MHDVSNIIELQCIVVADEEWFLMGLSSPPVWSNKVDSESAERFSLREASKWVKLFGSRLAGHFKRISVQPVLDDTTQSKTTTKQTSWALNTCRNYQKL